MKSDNSLKAPTISVIIPVYNQELFIAQCLDSVLTQSFKDLEVILVDDGSTDRTVDILKKYNAQHKRVRLLSQKNKGAGAARNLGLDHANGEYIHFMDADDWLVSKAYAKLMEVKRACAADITVFLYNRYDQKTKKSVKVPLFPTQPESITKSNYLENRDRFFNTSVVPWNKLYSHKYLKRISARFDEIQVANDRTFYFSTITQTLNVVLYSSVLINYRTNNDASLVGKGRADRFDCILQSSTNTARATESLDNESKKYIFENSVRDILHFYDRATISQKEKILPSIIRHFSSVNVPFDSEELKKKEWSAQFLILRGLGGIQGLAKKIVPIVMATNDNYAPYLSVTLQSISEHLSEDAYCDIYVFHSGLQRKYIQSFEMAGRWKNIRVACIDVSAIAVAQETYCRAHYSVEMYYRILIPELLGNYDKVLYLDCDLVLNRNVEDLYEIDVSGYDLAGVKNFCNQSMYNWIANNLKLDPGTYVNSGVLIFNNNNFRENNSKEKCFELLQSRDFLACPDQDMLNYACRGRIKIIDSGWNFQWHHGFKKYKLADTIDFSVPDLQNAMAKRYIVHFTSGVKAWSHPLYEFAEEFWVYARKSNAYSEITAVNAQRKCKQILEQLKNTPKVKFVLNGSPS